MIRIKWYVFESILIAKFFKVWFEIYIVLDSNIFYHNVMIKIKQVFLSTFRCEKWHYLSI